MACRAEIHASLQLTGLLAAHYGELTVDPTTARRAIARFDAQQRKPPARIRIWGPVASTALLIACVAATVWFASQLKPAVSVVPETETPEAPAVAEGDAATPETNRVTPEPVVAPPEHVLSVRGSGDAGPGAVLETKRGERRLLKLSDGTTLHLNHDTRVRLVADQPRTMTVERGEVFLDVVKQAPLPPLIVDVPVGTVRVTGTRLMVSVNGDEAAVDVLRGEVVAMTGAGSATLHAGEEAVLRAEGTPRVRTAADLGEATRWTDLEAEEAEGTMGLGTLRARRPGAKADTEQALTLAEHKVSIHIQGQVARTEIEESFRNDTDKTLEGVYSFPLPPGAQIAALDLVVDGEWMEGAMVERERGEKIWRGVIRNATPKHKRRDRIEYVWVPGPWKDPAILTWKAGSEFELRIFPIDAKSERRVRIAYTQTLPAVPNGRRYVYPMAADSDGKVVAEKFQVEARIGSLPDGPKVRATPYDFAERVENNAVVLNAEVRNFRPQGDLVIDVPQREADAELKTWAYREPVRSDPARDFGLLALRPDLPATGTAGGMDVLFVVDTSYSMQKTRLDRAGRLIGRVVAELDRESRVHVLGCGTLCRAVGPGFRDASSRVAADLRKRVAAVEPLGATRLEHIFSAARKTLDSADARAGARVIYIGDGTPSVGELEPKRLADKARIELGDARLTAVSLGGNVDDLVLAAMAAAGRGAVVTHDAGKTLRTTAFELLQRQRGEPLRNAEITLPEGFGEIAPAALGDVWPGQERLIAGRLTSGAVKGEAVLRGTLAGKPFEKRWTIDLEPTTAAGNAFLPRLWAERRISDLQSNDGDHKTIVELSKRYHVLSRHTSLLVLESEAMARAFKVEKTRPDVEWSGADETLESLADAGDSNKSKAGESRKDSMLLHGITSADASSSDGYYNLGAGRAGMGFKGTGKGGGGLTVSKPARATTASPRPKREVKVKMPKARRGRVSGNLDNNVINRVVRRNMGSIRRVYERSLRSNPNMSGRVNLRFTIGENGRVISANVRGSASAEVRNGIQRVARRWRFPARPGGGPVTVTYPFVFSASDSGSTARQQAPITRDPFGTIGRIGGMRGRNRGGSWVPMKKVWYREATVSAHGGSRTSKEHRELRRRETRLGENPDSRDRTRDLLRWHVRTGDLDAAQTLADRWLAKDRMDAGALVSLADLAALRGDVQRSHQLLASAVDVDPRNPTAHRRLADMYEAAAEQSLRCAHALTLSLVAPKDWKAQVEAVRCGGERTRHLDTLSRRDRRKAERALAKAPKAKKGRTPLRIDATWETDADLDIVVITPKGRAVSWSGGARRTRATDALSDKGEKLAMSTGEVGRYQIFIIHPEEGDATAPVSGKVRIRAHGQRRTISFTTDGHKAAVADVNVARKWRHQRM